MNADTKAMVEAGERRAVERADGDLWDDYQRLSYRCINFATRCTRLEIENRTLRAKLATYAREVELGMREARRD